jgi:hypothetical protein
MLVHVSGVIISDQLKAKVFKNNMKNLLMKKHSLLTEKNMDLWPYRNVRSKER